MVIFRFKTAQVDPARAAATPVDTEPTAANLARLVLRSVRFRTKMQSPKSGVRLDWQGKAIGRTAPPAELSLVQSGNPSQLLIQGDNLAALHVLARRARASFSLIYLDPPFHTGREHSHVRRKRCKTTGKLSRVLTPAFDDRWEGLSDYLGELAERIAVARELLRADGCLVLHVDPKTSHYLKILCDEIFGQRCFASEIVWRYRRWPARTPNFQRVHDVLLRYVRDADEKPKFRQLYEPLAPSTLATWGDRKQRAVVGGDGRRVRSSRTEDLTPGTPMGDVWDIGIVAPVARERTGYPTQKPEALLERLITACTDPGDLVLDPYVGSGTTMAVSARLERRAVGIDQSGEAIKVARARLSAIGVAPLEERVRSLSHGPTKTSTATDPERLAG